MGFWAWLTQARILTPCKDKPWIKLREWDGRYFVDTKEFVKSQEFKDQMAKIRKMLESSKL